jgi:hypothetical protein
MEPVIRLHPHDDVVIARHQLISGTKLASEDLTIRGLVPPGHKVATKKIKQGDPVRRYNQIIGFASADIEPGSHVHIHNLSIGAEGGAFSRDYAVGVDAKPTQYVATPRTFKGIVRADGRVDILGNMRTELLEETGLDLGEATPGPMAAIFEGPRLAVVQRFDFPLTFPEIEQRFAAHAAGDDHAELSAVEALRGRSQIDSRMPGYVAELVRHFHR